MACVKCVENRLLGVGFNMQVEGGELRILGCKKHILMLTNAYKVGEQSKQEEIKKNEQVNSEADKGSTAGIDTADSQKDTE